MRRFGVVLVVADLSVALTSAQVPAGGEFQIAYWPGATPAVAANSTGGFVVVWEGWGRRYDAAGSALGGEFTVGAGLKPSIATDAAGRFVVAGTGSDGSDTGVFAQLFDASGVYRGPSFQVNTHSDQYQSYPAVAADAAGNFVVVWEDQAGADGEFSGVFGQRFDASGARLGSEFQVNTYTTGWQESPAVAADAAGNFVVVWTSTFGQDADFKGVFAQRFAASGARLGLEFQVNTYTKEDQSEPSVVADAAGNFVVVWTSLGQDGSWTGVFAQRFAASGEPLGGEFMVNATTTDDQWTPSVSMDATGNFVVVWAGGDFMVDLDAFARSYDAAGAPRGSETRVNTYTTGWQILPAVASDPAGNILVTWSSRNPFGLFAQRYGGIVPAAVVVDTAASASSDGNGVLEAGESVDVKPSWWNVIGAAQSFGAVASSFSGPAASGVSYELMDAVGDYGTVDDGATVLCADCYRVGITFGGTRPSTHWDATFTERITPDVLALAKPWPLHVGESFADVPTTSPYYRFVETLLHRGVTGGCAAASYCPTSSVTREQVAVFALLGKEGRGYLPQRCDSPPFSDVPKASPFCRYISELARRGVVSGCGGGNYCPAEPVTREQMPVFVLRVLDPWSSPPPCGTPMFGDVPASSPYCPWIEHLARRGVVSGCGGGNYCPADPVTREQMAVFVTATFGLTLYGP